MQQRPILIMNLELVNVKQFGEECYINAFSYFLGIIVKYCMIPGKIENWIFVMDSKGLGLGSFPFKVIGTTIKTMQLNFCGRLEKLYILNPSSSLNTSWKIIKAFLDKDTAAKISFVKSTEIQQLQERISKDQLEVQFGGTVPNVDKFWPPMNLALNPPIPEEILKQIESMNITSIQIEKEKAKTEQEEKALLKQMEQIKIEKEDEDDGDDD